MRVRRPFYGAIGGYNAILSVTRKKKEKKKKKRDNGKQ